MSRSPIVLARAGDSPLLFLAKTRARLLSSIPTAGRGTRVFLLDLHVDGLTHYFEGAVHPVNV